MTGFRVGYACGPADIIDGILKIHQYGILCAPTVSQEAAIEALRNGKKSMLEMREKYRERRDFIVRRFNGLGLKCHSPRGSFYAFPDITSTGLSSMEFAKKLLEAERVAMVPGTAFGACGEGFCRASFSTSYTNIDEACIRIERFLKSLKH